MAEEKQPESVPEAGSSTTDPQVDAPGGESGEDASSHVEGSDFVPKSQYEELQTLLGQQGAELGEYREFFNKVTPLLDKLEDKPDLIQAIIDDKIDENLIKSVAEGEVTLKTAKEVTKAHGEVKKDLGKKEYTGMSPEKVEELVAAKVKENTSELERKLSEKEELKDFESRTNSFIDETPDFPDYADRISQWFEDHPEQDDIRVAYDAVKGKTLAEQEGIAAAEAAKSIASNAGGGDAPQSGTIQSEELVDSLISTKSNPNML